jgi:hypothetical protein
MGRSGEPDLTVVQEGSVWQSKLPRNALLTGGSGSELSGKLPGPPA